MDIKTEIRIKDIVSHILSCESLSKHYKKKKKRKQQWFYDGKAKGLESALANLIGKSIVIVMEMVADEKFKRAKTEYDGLRETDYVRWLVLKEPVR